jgi:hypothetical protein
LRIFLKRKVGKGAVEALSGSIIPRCSGWASVGSDLLGVSVGVSSIQPNELGVVAVAFFASVFYPFESDWAF